jgi:hypothetical protein
MKKLGIYFILLCAFKNAAQQSLFNVPSISITKKKEVFFQEQANILVDGTNTINFNTAYGLGHQLEIGINLVGVGLGFDKNNPVLITNSSSSDKQPYSPLIMLTSLKAFSLGEHIKIGVGAQVGLNPMQNKITTNDIATLDFINVRFEIPKTHLMVCGGGYYSNKVYMGLKDQLGGMLGFEYVIIEHKFLVMSDWIISKNAVSVIVPGFVYHPHHNIALSFGWQLPSPGTNNAQGFVFELTLGNFSSK